MIVRVIVVVLGLLLIGGALAAIVVQSKTMNVVIGAAKTTATKGLA